jgi:hypothetical protein
VNGLYLEEEEEEEEEEDYDYDYDTPLYQVFLPHNNIEHYFDPRVKLINKNREFNRHPSYA